MTLLAFELTLLAFGGWVHRRRRRRSGDMTRSGFAVAEGGGGCLGTCGLRPPKTGSEESVLGRHHRGHTVHDGPTEPQSLKKWKIRGEGAARIFGNARRRRGSYFG